MADPPPPPRLRLDRLPAHARAAITVVGLTLVYTAIEVTLTRPHLWPAGAGAVIAGDAASRLPVVARPPDLRRERGREPAIESIVDGGPAARAGLEPAMRIVRASVEDRGTVTFVDPPVDDAASADRGVAGLVLAWRSRTSHLTVRDSAGARRDVSVARPSAVARNAPGWRRNHLG